MHLDRVGNVGAPVQEEPALGRHRSTDERPSSLGVHAQALLLADLGERHLARPVEDDPHGAGVRMLDQQDHRPGEVRILHLRDGDEQARREVVHTGQHTTLAGWRLQPQTEVVEGTLL